MNLMRVDHDREISDSRYVFTFRLPPCQDSRSEIVIEFLRLRLTRNIMVFPGL